jgi:ActR/RegA family two-component response regulator
MGNNLLLALHDESILRSYSRVGKLFGYQVHSVKTKEELLAEAKRGGYFGWVQDLNFGAPNSGDKTIAEEAYATLQTHHPETRFMALSGNPKIIEAIAQSQSPIKDHVKEKMQFDIVEFLKRE